MPLHHLQFYPCYMLRIFWLFFKLVEAVFFYLFVM